MKTQTFLVEVTDLTGQSLVSEGAIESAMNDVLPDHLRVNVVEQHRG